MMEAILGPLPPRFIRETRKTKYFWHSQLDWDPESPDGKYVREHCRKLKVIESTIACLCVLSHIAVCLLDNNMYLLCTY